VPTLYPRIIKVVFKEEIISKASGIKKFVSRKLIKANLWK
jgi:hypothetical protein